MKQLFVLVLSACAVAGPFAQTNMGVSISIAQPGAYGRIDIGNVSPPRLVYAQPMLIQQSPMAVQQPPIYLYVPPGHQKKWAKHCGRYNACSQQVFFVREDWVQERYNESRRQGEPSGNGHDRGHGKAKKDKNGHKD